ncbi:hypothetical protein [Paenibacillus polymyxa]|uniref:hypothetical protein n=1 Tax=Paenibacillus polymyxa TaxID=1406 RepID=UPI0025B645D1|nr:hypothetical protein [Paenibacillus polymyxa]MDN4090966.1 hypothetical protein [Paenibacillus polymyxa]
MAFLEDSSKKEEIRERYEQLWEELLVRDEEEAEKVLEKLEYRFLPTSQKIIRPFKTHLTWIIPLGVIIFFVLAYVLFIYIALWVED